MNQRRPAQLFLLGFLTLFVELALIRYLPGSIWNLGYFPNLVLLAVFIGMGLGFVFHGRFRPPASSWIFSGAALLLFGLVAFVYYRRPVLPGFGQWAGDIGGELYFTNTPLEVRTGEDSLVFAVCFATIVAAFAAISQRTAKLFVALPPLQAYTFDILGSCAGVLAFMLVSWLQLPPYGWFVILVPMFLLAADASSRARWMLPVPLALMAVVAWKQDSRLTSDPRHPGPFEVHWSPYQKIELVGRRGEHPTIFANGIGHQEILSAPELDNSFYRVPYTARARRGDLPPYRRVLVIGAGSGNDVAAALRNGATEVHAVEIDPAIVELGRRYNTAEPYADPRVRVIVDDGRAFMTRTPHRYDLIVFALTDSLVKVSSMAQLRLENYLFTEGSLRQAYSLLTEDGDIVLYNYYRYPWLIEKLRHMLHAATGRYPQVAHQAGDFMVFMVGPRTEGSSPTAPVREAVDIAVDDWPFPYLRTRGIPALYVRVALGFALAIFVLMMALHRGGTAGAARSRAPLRLKLAFLFMGAAFLLLETKSVVQFSLLFGTTWVNSSLVFLAVLLLVLAANWTALLLRSPRVLPIVSALLVASCLISVAFPLTHLLRLESALARFVLASLLTFVPVFFANLIFSVSFRDQDVAEHLFGWNLLGAALGGVLEYSSMALGYTALALIVAACYALVAVLLGRGTLPATARSELSAA